MLSEKQIELLKAGAYGVTRDGRKIKYIGETGSNFCWVVYKNNGTVASISSGYDTFDTYIRGEEDDDIVGLWQDKPEPFDLGRALAGEPVKTRIGYKAYLKFVKNGAVYPGM